MPRVLAEAIRPHREIYRDGRIVLVIWKWIFLRKVVKNFSKCVAHVCAGRFIGVDGELILLKQGIEDCSRSPAFYEQSASRQTATDDSRQARVWEILGKRHIGWHGVA
jgi:hypothetical protein